MTRIGFVECLTADFERIPDRTFYEDCAAKHSIDLQVVDRCVARDGGEYGYKLLRESVRRSIDVSETRLPSVVADESSLFYFFFIYLFIIYNLTPLAEKVGARISGTIRLNEEIYCIRDKGVWRDCPNGAGVDDLVNAIEQLHNARIDL